MCIRDRSGADSKCELCSDQHANHLATQTAQCAQQSCPEGYGTVTDNTFLKSRDPNPTGGTISANCEPCTGSTVSGATVGVCKAVVCIDPAKYIVKDEVNLNRELVYNNPANCKCRNDKENNGICDEDEVYRCRDSGACNFNANDLGDTEDNSLCEFFGSPGQNRPVPDRLKFAVDCQGTCKVGFTRENDECKVEENQDTGLETIRNATNNTQARKDALMTYFEGLVEADDTNQTTDEAKRYDNRVTVEIEEVVMPQSSLAIIEAALKVKQDKAMAEYNATLRLQQEQANMVALSLIHI